MRCELHHDMAVKATWHWRRARMMCNEEGLHDTTRGAMTGEVGTALHIWHRVRV